MVVHRFRKGRRTAAAGGAGRGYLGEAGGTPAFPGEALTRTGG